MGTNYYRKSDSGKGSLSQTALNHNIVPSYQQKVPTDKIDIILVKQVPLALDSFHLFILFVNIHKRALKRLVAFTLEAPCMHPEQKNVCTDLL